jgi:hypothetical protein
MCKNACAEQLLQSPWLVNTKINDQPRYQSSVNCHWWNIFDWLNDWTVASLVWGEKGDDENYDLLEEAQNLFLESMSQQA